MLQREGDEEYYSKHSENGAYYSGGSIFSQDYNQKDFSDPMTVLYGHNLRNGRMFAQLNDFSDAEVFEAHRYIYIYLPDRMLVYEIFAAYPHSNEHLLLCHDFCACTPSKYAVKSSASAKSWHSSRCSFECG